MAFFKDFYLHPAFSTKEDRIYWLRFLNAYNHEIHEDGSISILGQKRVKSTYTSIVKGQARTVSFRDELKLKHIPFKFRKVNMNFDLSNSGITSLEGCPEIVMGDFDCSYTNIASLTNAPSFVKDSFVCDSCPNLTSLKGCPETVPYIFSSRKTKISSLEGGPKKVQKAYVDFNPHLTSLKGAPEFFEKHSEGTDSSLLFSFEGNKALKDLVGLPYADNLEYRYIHTKFTREEIEKAKNSSRIHSHMDQEEKDIFGGVF